MKIGIVELQEVLTYHKDSGFFTWNISGSGIVGGAGTIAGCQNADGYITITINSKPYKAHVLAWFYITKEWPTMDIDHINRVRNDNRFINLRHVTKRVNNTNSSNNNEFIGTRFKPKQPLNPWNALIEYKGKRIDLGNYPTVEEASEAYQKAFILAESGIAPTAAGKKLAKGYSFEASRNKWRVRLTIDGVYKSFGSFNTEQEAIEKVKELRGQI